MEDGDNVGRDGRNVFSTLLSMRIARRKIGDTEAMAEQLHVYSAYALRC